MKANRKIVIGAFVLGTALVCAVPPLPKWWGTGGVDISGTASPKSPANLGQLKNMAWNLHLELEMKLPGGAGFALEEVFPPRPDNPSNEWYDQQKAIANIGQLKAVAHPFYERLNSLAPDWVAEQMADNDPNLSGWPHPYPWDPSTPVEENKKLANLGQLKLVFSLRIREDKDNDDVPDLLEHILYGDASKDGATSDYDGDGLSDAKEYDVLGTSLFNQDTDGDGLTDKEEDDNGTNPLIAEVTSTWDGANAILLTPTDD